MHSSDVGRALAQGVDFHRHVGWIDHPVDWLEHCQPCHGQEDNRDAHRKGPETTWSHPWDDLIKSGTIDCAIAAVTR